MIQYKSVHRWITIKTIQGERIQWFYVRLQTKLPLSCKAFFNFPWLTPFVHSPSHCMPLSESFGITSEIPTADSMKPRVSLTAFKLLVQINYLPKHVWCCYKLWPVSMSLYDIDCCIYHAIFDACMFCHQYKITKKIFQEVYEVFERWIA